MNYLIAKTAKNAHWMKRNKASYGFRAVLGSFVACPTEKLTDRCVDILRKSGHIEGASLEPVLPGVRFKSLM